MNSLDTRRYEMLVRVRDFGAAHSDLFAKSSLAGRAFASVASAVSKLMQHAASQQSGRSSAREGTTSKAVAREALREDLDAIVRTARGLALDTPGIDDRFRAPRSSRDQALVNHARAFSADAAPLATAFVEHGMPEDFLDDLGDSIKELEDAIRERNEGRQINAAAQTAIDEAMEEALEAVRRLDAIVPNVLRKSASQLSAWELARRVEYRGARKAEPAEAAASTSQAAAT